MGVTVEHTYTHIWSCDGAGCPARILNAYASAAISPDDLQRRIPSRWVVRTEQTSRGTIVKYLCEKCAAS